MREKDQLLESLRTLVKTNLDVLSLDCTEKFPRTKRSLQHFLSIKPPQELKTMYELLLSSAIKAEKACPNSGDFILRKFVGESRQLLLPRNRKDLLELYREMNISRSTIEILNVAADLASPTTKIVLKKSSGKTSVELSDGYTFDLNSLLKIDQLFLEEARVACIDGYVESVSEIHHLLTELSENKIPCIFFCRGMSEDVLHTIKINNDRKTVIVYPYRVPFDLENVNTIVDLAITSGTDVISTTKGELISSINFQKLGRAKTLYLSTSQIRYQNSETIQTVKNHIRTMNERMEERNDIVDFLVPRLKSLSSSLIEISIPDDINYYSKSSELDLGIRVLSSFINNLYDPEEISKIYYRSFLENVSNIGLCLL